MKSYKVTFMPLTTNTHVDPPIIEGKRDSVWVNAETKADAQDAAITKMMRCYRVTISDIVVCD